MTPSERTKAWRKANPDKNKERWHREELKRPRAERRRKSIIADPRKAMLYRARQRALLLGLEFNLTVEDIIVPSICPVLGIELVNDCGTSGKSNSPSLDRIDNAKGYIRGNVAVISGRANRIKSDATLGELRQLVEYLEWQATLQHNS